MLLLILLAILVTETIQPTPKLNDGPCPDIPVFADFDAIKFIDKPWYTLYEDTAQNIPFMEKLKCNEKRFSYALYSNGTRAIIAEEYNLYKKNQRPYWHRWIGEQGSTPGVYISPATNSSALVEIQFRVVDIDYDSYFVAHFCRYNNKTKQRYEIVGINGRTPSQSLPEGKLEESATFFKQYNLEINLTAFDWSDCRARCNK